MIMNKEHIRGLSKSQYAQKINTRYSKMLCRFLGVTDPRKFFSMIFLIIFALIFLTS